MSPEAATLGQALRALADGQRQTAELLRQQADALAILAGAVEQAVDRASNPPPASVLHHDVELRIMEAAQVAGLSVRGMQQRVLRGTFPAGHVVRGIRRWRVRELLEWRAR
jgi:hypothetical protein